MTPEKDVNPDALTVAAANGTDSTVGKPVTAAEFTAEAEIDQTQTDQAQRDQTQADQMSAANNPADVTDPEGTVGDSPVDADDPLGFGDERMRDSSDAGTAAEQDTVESLQARLEQAESKVADSADRLLRLQAEMENQRKRSQKELANARKFALEAVVNDLLPVKDSLEMGLTAAGEADSDLAKIIEGSELTLKMLSQAFEKYNICEINPLDEKFDPAFHQAMSVQEIEGKETNTVTSVLQKGYTLNERLIRPALVMVAK